MLKEKKAVSVVKFLYRENPPVGLDLKEWEKHPTFYSKINKPSLHELEMARFSVPTFNVLRSTKLPFNLSSL
jgi:hypothetical protein